jgi:hypothetical protein
MMQIDILEDFKNYDELVFKNNFNEKILENNINDL